MKPSISLRIGLQTVALTFMLALPSLAHAEKPAYMVEVLSLKTGATVSQAESYFQSVYPIIASYGLFPVKAYQVVQDGGSGSPQIVQIWRVENPQGMPKIMADPKYQQFISTRDAIFDLKGGRIGYMGSELY